MNRRAIRIIYYSLLGILLIAYAVYTGVKLGRKGNTSYLDDQNVPADYLKLFDQKDTIYFKKTFNYSTKYRFPISLFDYKSQYALIIYKISDSIEIPLSKEITVRKVFSDNNSNEVYTVVNENHFDMYYRDETIKKVSQINLNLYGDSITTQIKSDSLILYYMLFNHISWSTNAGDPLDIYIEPRGIAPLTGKIPASIAFVKRGKCLYFILLSVNGLSKSMDRSILLKLLTHETIPVKM